MSRSDARKAGIALADMKEQKFFKCRIREWVGIFSTLMGSLSMCFLVLISYADVPVIFLHYTLSLKIPFFRSRGCMTEK